MAIRFYSSSTSASTPRRRNWRRTFELPQIGQARIARIGADVTLIAYSAMVRNALEAADELEREGLSVEVIDLRTLLPLDMATIAASVSKTHRVVIAHEAVQNGGVGAEISARIGIRAVR